MPSSSVAAIPTPAATTTRQLGRLRFNEEDQLRFASLTGDRNPMHVDPVAARRLITGRPVVHGIHVLLAALERLPERQPLGGLRLSAEFVNPVSVGDEVMFASGCNELGHDQLWAEVDGLVCTRVVWEPAPGSRSMAYGTLQGDALTETVVITEEPLDRTPEDWVGRRQTLALPIAEFQSSFPALCQDWGERTVAAIGLLSTYVGMVCPGQHSVFASVSLAAGHAVEELVFEVQRHDPRFGLYTITFDGALHGQIKAFVRPQPQTQPSILTLASRVAADAFAGRHAWVIGGSRGLGELSAKLIAAGGGEVTITFTTGSDDANRVAKEIAEAGFRPAEVASLNVATDDVRAWVADHACPDAVFYFPSPRIFRKSAHLVDAVVLNDFLDCYVHHFAALCEAIAGKTDRPVSIFVPSSIAISERPRGLVEYAMAKAAAEILLVDLAREHRQLRFVVERLPRLATDQTSTLAGSRAPAGTDVLLPLVHRVMSGG
ncbi:MAG: MaoC/PaaZ C-terminal domain-containing protein [Rhizobacter sp.]